MSDAPGDTAASPAPASESPQTRLARGLELLRGGASVRRASDESGSPRSTLRRAALKAGVLSPRGGEPQPDTADGNLPYLRVEIEALEERVAALEAALDQVRRDALRLRSPATAAALEGLPPIEGSSPARGPESGSRGG